MGTWVDVPPYGTQWLGYGRPTELGSRNPPEVARVWVLGCKSTAREGAPTVSDDGLTGSSKRQVLTLRQSPLASNGG